jgi:TonB-dependent receptor
VTLNNGTTITIVQADKRHQLFTIPAVVQRGLEREPENVKLRFAGSRTITRANPRDMLPNAQFSDPSAQALTVGNPSLAPYLSTNFDLGGEWYTGDEGYVGLTLFQKQITGFTVGELTVVPFSSLAPLGITYDTLSPTQQTAITSRGGPNLATVNQTRRSMPRAAQHPGYEVTWVQPLNFVTDGFGFQANYTNVKQSTEGGTGHRRSPWEFHRSPTTPRCTTTMCPASVRLSFVHNDEQIASGTNQEGIAVPASGPTRPTSSTCRPASLWRACRRRRRSRST